MFSRRTASSLAPTSPSSTKRLTPRSASNRAAAVIAAADLVSLNAFITRYAAPSAAQVYTDWSNKARNTAPIYPAPLTSSNSFYKC